MSRGRERQLLLVHWREDEQPRYLELLRSAGLEAEGLPPAVPAVLRRLREQPPDALLISLDRLPSHGRELGLAVRRQAATRRLPIVFAGGRPEKAERLRRELPDELVCAWAAVARAVDEALARPPRERPAPEPYMARYAGRPLAAKLGIKPGERVLLCRAPEGFERLLEPLPQDARVGRRFRRPVTRLVWFVRDERRLLDGLERVLARLAPAGALWIAWPKRGAPLAGDLGQADVRRLGIAAGLVDYKICSIDDSWSGLLFTRRRRQRR